MNDEYIYRESRLVAERCCDLLRSLSGQILLHNGEIKGALIVAKDLMIGDLARLTGTKVNTIRFYEDSGLMRKAMRTESGRRVYSQGDVGRLAFIRHARSLGFSTETIRSLLSLADQPASDCGTAQRLAAAQLVEVRDKLAKLSALETELTQLVGKSCEGGPASDCRVLEALSTKAVVD